MKPALFVMLLVGSSAPVSAATSIISCAEVGEGVNQSFSITDDGVVAHLSIFSMYRDWNLAKLSAGNQSDISQVDVSIGNGGCTSNPTLPQIRNCYEDDGTQHLVTFTHGVGAKATKEDVAVSLASFNTVQDVQTFVDATYKTIHLQMTLVDSAKHEAFDTFIFQSGFCR